MRRPTRPGPLRLLADTYQAIAAVLTKLGETAAAWAAAERSVAAAERAGLPLLAAAGDLRLAQAFLSAGQLDQAERVLSLTAAGLEPKARRDSPPELLSVWGTLNLIWAIIATRQGQERAALDFMSTYNTLRPHQALDERTPRAAYLAVEHCD